MSDERLLRVSEAAQRLGLKESTIRAWLLHRRIDAVRLSGRAIRIPASEIDKLILRNRIPAREVRG